MPSSLEAKIVVLGAQGVGKTSLVNRYCKGGFDPGQTTSTVGASFLTKRVFDADTDTTVRLQIWDTAGQERFRSISRLYYRGANACILCYSITDAQSFLDMGVWLAELRRNLPGDVILHVVGTKADLVTREPARREVPFERCIAYVAENLAPGQGSTPPPTAISPGSGGAGLTLAPGAGAGTLSAGTSTPGVSFASAGVGGGGGSGGGGGGMGSLLLGSGNARSPSSNRSSGFWGQEAGWDACHEISAESGEGVEEVFRVVARKLVEQNRKIKQAVLMATATPGTPGYEAGMDGGYFGQQHPHNHHGHNQLAPSQDHGGSGGEGGLAAGGSFRVGRDRRSWLFSPGFVGPGGVGGGGGEGSATNGVSVHLDRGYSHDGVDGPGGSGRRCC